MFLYDCYECNSPPYKSYKDLHGSSFICPNCGGYILVDDGRDDIDITDEDSEELGL